MTRTPFESGQGMPEQNDTPDPGFPFGPDAAGERSGDLDELALRRLLHDAVRDVEPREGSLDHLSRAVPARRARRRQVMVGAAAGVLLVGTAVPAAVHLADLGYDASGSAHSSDSQASGSDPATLGGEGPGGLARRRTGPGGTGHGPAATAPSLGPGASPVTSDPADAPPCSRGQLGQGSAHTDTPDALGRVYGVFRVVNVSGTSCAVVGDGQIAVAAQGSATAGGIQVVAHTQGDPATPLLPNPSEDPAAVVLPPGQAYQVQFAWIPASGGGPSGCATDPPPPSGNGGTATPGAGGTGGDSGGTTAGADATTAGGTADSAGTMAPDSTTDDGGGGTSASPSPTTPGPAGDAAVSLSTIPPEGGPAAATTDISGACAGTVYQTDPLPTA